MAIFDNVLPDLPPIDFSTRAAFKYSLYNHVYTRVRFEASRGDFHHLDTDDVSVIQVLDSDIDDDVNPLKRNIMYYQPKGKGGGDWYMYDGYVWVKHSNNIGQDAVSVILKAVDFAYEDLIAAKEISLPVTEDADNSKAMKNFVERVKKHKKIRGNLGPYDSATLYMTKYLSKAEDPFTVMKYIVLQNGQVMDIKKSIDAAEPVFVQTYPEDFIHEMYRMNANYIKGSKPGKALTHYLKTSFQDYETGENMCRAFACGMFSPRSSKSYSIIDMYGKPNTGKSTFFESVIREVAPGLIAIGGAEQFGKAYDKFAMKDLVGKRVTILAEFDKNFSTGTVKRVTGEDTLRYEEKYGASGNFVYQGVIAVTSNFRTGSKIDIAEDGVIERLFPVHFPHSFKYGVGISEDGVASWDGPDLRYEALPAENDTTFSWMIDLWLEYEQEEIPEIPLTDSQKAEIKFRTGESDLFAQFLSDMVAINGWTEDIDAKAVHCVRATTVQLKYANWLQDQGYPRNRAPQDIKKLKNEGRVAKKSGNLILVGWQEGSHEVRNSISGDDTINGYRL